MPERNVYGIKARHAAKFVAAVHRCNAQAITVGTVHGDNTDITFFSIPSLTR
jgi:hypothetical protein